MQHHDIEIFQFNNQHYELRTRSDFHTVFVSVYQNDQLIGQEYSLVYPHGVGVLQNVDPLTLLKQYTKEQFILSQHS
ncbi:hypothetical protein [Oceanicoccus sp. KOV_DT_Chl]|uniref:hypothetical protein n=1 Tax=Oceanicoccus sp. KOV_DT_Chl TaxID=1904639 RepID=UPI000C7B3718|nr:hypothetical protein [Oceanicoccus sp. KOV_DT_Chl]